MHKFIIWITMFWLKYKTGNAFIQLQFKWKYVLNILIIKTERGKLIWAIFIYKFRDKIFKCNLFKMHCSFSIEIFFYKNVICHFRAFSELWYKIIKTVLNFLEAEKVFFMTSAHLLLYSVCKKSYITSCFKWIWD